MRVFTEGKASFYADERDIVSADMGVFYNPAMRENRDLSLLAIDHLLRSRTKPVTLLFPMIASGVRPLRLFEELELPEGSRVFANDRSARAIHTFRESIPLNEHATQDALIVSQRVASGFFADAPLADYIEIDPFGSPLEFLDPALQRIKHRGILSVTATDTAALCGTYPKTGLRKYHAFTARSPLMHEHAARILAHVVERHASRYAKAARIIFAYSHLHYVKLFFEIRDSKSESSRLIRDAEFWRIDRTGYTSEKRTFEQGRDGEMIGPLSAQPLYDETLLDHIGSSLVEVSPTLEKNLETIRAEASIHGSAIDLHVLASELELEAVPKVKHVLERLDPASRTHFCDTAIRTTASKKDIEQAMRDA